MARVGIDIGGSSVKAVRLARGPSADAASRAAHAGDGPASLAAAVREAADGCGIRAGDDIAVCCPGRADPETGVIERAANLPFLVGVSPASLVEAALGTRPARSLTDAAAWGFAAWRHAHEPDRLLTLALGTGVGASLLDRGSPITVDGRGPGHIGQVDVSGGDPDAPVGPDGGRGSLEAYVGLRALDARFGRDRLPRALATMTRNDPAFRALATALRICHAIYRPNAVVLCGGVGALFTPVLGALKAAVDDRLTSVADPSWTLDAFDDPFGAARGAALSVTPTEDPANP